MKHFVLFIFFCISLLVGAEYYYSNFLDLPADLDISLRKSVENLIARNDRIEVIFLGNSVPLGTIDPEKICFKEKLQNFSFANESNLFSFLKLKELLRKGYLKNLNTVFIFVGKTDLLTPLPPRYDYSSLYSIPDLLRYAPAGVSLRTIKNRFSIFRFSQHPVRRQDEKRHFVKVSSYGYVDNGQPPNIVDIPLDDPKFSFEKRPDPSLRMDGLHVLADMVHFLQDRGLRVIFYDIPSLAGLYFNNETSLKYSIDRDDDFLEVELRKLFPNIPFFNYRRLEIGLQRMDFMDTVHLAESGSKKIMPFVESDLKTVLGPCHL